MIHDDNFFNFLAQHDKKKLENKIYKKKKRGVETTCGTLHFSSITEAGLAINAIRQNIYQSINLGFRCKGYYWQYSDKKIKQHPEVINKENEVDNESN